MVCPDYGLLLELHALTLAARSYALLICVQLMVTAGALPAPPGGGGGNQFFNTGFGGSVGIAPTGKAFMLLLLGSLVCLYLFIF